MPNPTPTERGGRQATFEALAEDFQLDNAVLQHLIISQMSDLEDFRFYVTSDAEVTTWVAAAGLQGDELRINAARVRRAWYAVRLACYNQEQGKSASSAVELDDPLGEDVLHSYSRNLLLAVQDSIPCAHYAS